MENFKHGKQKMKNITKWKNINQRQNKQNKKTRQKSSESAP